jgi:hypothetical protein
MMPFPRRKRNRLGNVARRTEYGGVTYDSKAEAEHASVLDWETRLRPRRIWAWLRQVNIPLGVDFTTRVDFLVITVDGRCHVEEVKGVETARFKTVRRLWPKYGPCELHVLKKQGKIWHREVIPGKQGE